MEALAVIPKKNAVVVARDRCLELWQLHVSRQAAAQKTKKSGASQVCAAAGERIAA